MVPTKYLGLPLGANFKDRTIWNPILEKVERSCRVEKFIFIQGR